MSDGGDTRGVVVVTGLSGAGKSTALRALEDAGCFAIDNLPIVLLPRLLELGARTVDGGARLAIVVDAREGELLAESPRILAEARAAGHEVRTLFLDCEDRVLQQRYSETRRRHPLSPDGTVEAGIAAEREALREMRDLADEVVDTTNLNVHELKAAILDRFGEGDRGLAISLTSFGFKHGAPAQADLVFDVRFLPNPYFVPELSALTGQDETVARYVLDRDETRTFLAHLEPLLIWLLPRYANEGKSHLTIAIGCTGGQHRSVALVEHLAGVLKDGAEDARVSVRHRELERRG